MSWIRLWPTECLRIFLLMFLGFGAVIGDKIVSRCHSNLSRAVADSTTHCFVGILTWVVISLNRKDGFNVLIYEVCICGILSSLIDIDHFLAARSTHLKDALNLPSRPLLHCTSLLFCFCILMISLFNMLNLMQVALFGWIFLASFLSHHIRDATRRGLWIWPFGSTPPIPYNMYITLTIFFPVILMLTMRYFYIHPKTYVKHVVEV